MDETEEFAQTLESDIAEFVKRKPEILQKGYKAADFEVLVRQWKDKLARCKNMDQTWGVFTGKRLFD